MTSLVELQESFQKFLICEDMDVVERHISATADFPVETRLGVYGFAYISRLVEALASHYPFLQTYLGESDFIVLSELYIHHHPSSFRSIRWYGDKLPEFILNQSQYKNFYSLYEIARLEWLLTLVFDAKDSVAMTLENMAQIDPSCWQDMRFIFHPTVRLAEFKYNVVECWQSSVHEGRLISLQEYPENVHWVFWRKDLMTHFHSISKYESWAMNAAVSNATFSDICEGLCNFMNESDVAMCAAGMLKSWIASEMVAEII